jgi:hypothetical protein
VPAKTEALKSRIDRGSRPGVYSKLLLAKEGLEILDT